MLTLAIWQFVKKLIQPIERLTLMLEINDRYASAETLVGGPASCRRRGNCAASTPRPRIFELVSKIGPLELPANCYLLDDRGSVSFVASINATDSGAND